MSRKFTLFTIASLLTDKQKVGIVREHNVHCTAKHNLSHALIKVLRYFSRLRIGNAEQWANLPMTGTFIIINGFVGLQGKYFGCDCGRGTKM